MSFRELELKRRGRDLGVGLSILWKHAGLLTLWVGDWSIHFALPPSHWKLGHSIEEYDQCLDYWGLGPLVLLVRCNLQYPDNK